MVVGDCPEEPEENGDKCREVVTERHGAEREFGIRVRVNKGSPGVGYPQEDLNDDWKQYTEKNEVNKKGCPDGPRSPVAGESS